MSRPMYNVYGTGGERCLCHNAPWIWHHEDITGSRQKMCSVYHCGNEARVGGHVWFGVSGVEFIVPLCHGCNKIPHHEAFDLKNRVKLAYADRVGWRYYTSPKKAQARMSSAGTAVALGAAAIGAVTALYYLTRPDLPPPAAPPG